MPVSNQKPRPASTPIATICNSMIPKVTGKHRHQDMGVHSRTSFSVESRFPHCGAIGGTLARRVRLREVYTRQEAKRARRSRSMRKAVSRKYGTEARRLICQSSRTAVRLSATARARARLSKSNLVSVEIAFDQTRRKHVLEGAGSGC